MSAVSLSSLPVGKAAEPHPTGQWGMICLIATEASLFAYLLFAYGYLAVRSSSPWPPGGPPDLVIALPNTILLLASSVVLHWAEGGLERGSEARVRIGVALTMAMGAAFLVLQGIEYSHKTFTPSSSAYGSAFFTITGVHGAHVLVGIIVLGFVLAMALRGKLDHEYRHYLKNASLYWHFVDAVWLVVLTALYLVPRLWS